MTIKLNLYVSSDVNNVETSSHIEYEDLTTWIECTYWYLDQLRAIGYIIPNRNKLSKLVEKHMDELMD